MDVLLVDDSRTMRMLVHRALRQAGYRDIIVAEAESGKQALDQMNGGIPKVILSDWNMPVMSGIEFLKELRRKGNSTPFIFITSEASPGIKTLAAENGACALITKPFTPEVIQTALQPYLGVH